MQIRAIKDIETAYNKLEQEKQASNISNEKFIASILADNLNITAKIEITRQLLAKNKIKAEIAKADTPAKFLVKIKDKSYCISFYQLFTDPDKVVKYIQKKL